MLHDEFVHVLHYRRTFDRAGALQRSAERWALEIEGVTRAVSASLDAANGAIEFLGAKAGRDLDRAPANALIHTLHLLGRVAQALELVSVRRVRDAEARSLRKREFSKREVR